MKQTVTYTNIASDKFVPINKKSIAIDQSNTHTHEFIRGDAEDGRVRLEIDGRTPLDDLKALHRDVALVAQPQPYQEEHHVRACVSELKSATSGVCFLLLFSFFDDDGYEHTEPNCHHVCILLNVCIVCRLGWYA